MNPTGMNGKPKRYKETRRNFMAKEYTIHTVYNQEEQKTYVALRVTKNENGWRKIFSDLSDMLEYCRGMNLNYRIDPEVIQEQFVKIW